MGHDKSRSSVSVGTVNWDDPHLSELLHKVDGWNIDQRSQVPGQDVEIRLTGGWSASFVSKPAVLMSEADETVVLATRYPLPHGEEVQVTEKAGVRWAVVVQEREGRRAGEREQGVFLNWLRVRSR